MASPPERFLDLRVFVQIVDSGSLTQAARVLGLSVPRVSRRLSELEDGLGVVLVQRTTRSLSVTDEGRGFYRHARRILAEMDVAMAELGSDDEVRGVVRATVPTIAAAGGLFEALGRLLDAYPGLAVQLAVSDQPVDAVTHGYDVVVHIGAPPDSQYVARRLVRVRPLLCATPDYLARRGVPEVPNDLSKHDCLRFISDRPQDEWTLVDVAGESHTVPVHGRLECDSSGALLRALYAGLGIGLVGGGMAARAEARGELVRVLPGYRASGITLFALVPSGRQRLPRVRRFVDFLEAFFVEELGGSDP